MNYTFQISFFNTLKYLEISFLEDVELFKLKIS